MADANGTAGRNTSGGKGGTGGKTAPAGDGGTGGKTAPAGEDGTTNANESVDDQTTVDDRPIDTAVDDRPTDTAVDDRPTDATTPEWHERIELKRRLVHAGGTVFPVPYLLGWLTWEETRLLLGLGAVLVGVLEFLRLGVGLDHALFEKLTRPYEEHNVAGYVLYMISIAAVAAVFDPVAAIPAILMLTLADPISGALGRNAANEPKRPVVWLVTFLVCTAIAAPFTVPVAGPRVGIAAAAAGAAGATVADGMPPLIRGLPVDDNFTIPPAAALGILLVLQFQ